MQNTYTDTEPAPLRLVSSRGINSSTHNAGRLEIFLNDQWGTISASGFDAVDATVACHQLGFEGYVFFNSTEEIESFRYYSHYHNSVMLICILALAIIYIFCSFTPVFNNVPIWLDNIGCTSDDTVIENCTKGGYRCTSSCYHYNDVGLSCYRSK